MNLSLTPELENFIETEVNSGLYRSASEVVRAGLRLLKEKHAPHLPELPATQKALEAQLRAAAASLDAGTGVDGKKSLRAFRNRVNKLGANG